MYLYILKKHAKSFIILKWRTKVFFLAWDTIYIVCQAKHHGLYAKVLEFFAILRKLNITYFRRCCLMKMLAFFHTIAVYFCQNLAGLLNITKWYLPVCNAPTDQVQRFLSIYLSLSYRNIFLIIHNQKEKLMKNSHLFIISHVTAQI